MKVDINKNILIDVAVKEGDRTVVFCFKDSEMTGTRQSMSYYKSWEDWKFYAKAIRRMLKATEKFYLKKKGEDSIPF